MTDTQTRKVWRSQSPQTDAKAHINCPYDNDYTNNVYKLKCLCACFICYILYRACRSKELELGGGAAALQGVGIQAVVTECLICYCDLIFNDKMPAFSSSSADSKSLCLFLCLSFSLSFCLSFSLPVCLSLFVCLSLSLCMSV